MRIGLAIPLVGQWGTSPSTTGELSEHFQRAAEDSLDAREPDREAVSSDRFEWPERPADHTSENRHDP